MMTPTVRAVVILVLTAAYLGFAVVGWGGLAFLAHPALVVLAVALLAQPWSGSRLLGRGSRVRIPRGSPWLVTQPGGT